MRYYEFNFHFGKFQRRIEKGLFFCKHDYNKQKEALEIFEVKGKNAEERAYKWLSKVLSEGFTIEVYTGRMYGLCRVVNVL